MQNPNVKYLKMSNGYFCVFYRENNALFFKTNMNNGWSSPQILAERMGSTFSICQHGQAYYVLYCSLEGNLYIITTQDFVNWEHKALPPNTSCANASRFFLVPDEESLHLIYSLPTETRGVESLVYISYSNGQWEKPYPIDRFIPFGRTSFLARRLRKEHIILYYRTARSTWSAREMLLTPFTMGSLTPMIQAPTNFIDISIVNDTERIHFLYTVRSMFRTQVVYQYKQATAISTPRILWEDANCDNCLAFLEHEKVVLMWTVNGQPLRCTSENNGATFGVVERYTGNFPARCTKGEVLGAEAGELNAMETYGDLSRSFQPFLLVNDVPIKPYFQALPVEHEVQTIPLKQEFSRQSTQPQAELWSQPAQSPPTRPQPASFVPDPPKFQQQVQPHPFSFEEELWPLRASSETQKAAPPPTQHTQQQNFTFDDDQFRQSFAFPEEGRPSEGGVEQSPQKQKIEELTALLAQRGDEISAVNAKWKTQVSRLETEVTALREENKQLKQSLHKHVSEQKKHIAPPTQPLDTQEVLSHTQTQEPLSVAEATIAQLNMEAEQAETGEKT